MNTPLREVVADALPEFGIDTANHAHVRVRGYTADQMREYARAALATLPTPEASAGVEEMAREALIEARALFAHIHAAESVQTHIDTAFDGMEICDAALRTPAKTEGDVGRVDDGMLPDLLLPHAKEWYRLCERRFSVDRITISGELAEAIVATIATPSAQQEARAVDDYAAAATLRDVRDALGLVPGENVVHYARLAADAQYELARTQNWLYDIHRDMPSFPVTAETAEAATDSLMSVCFLLGCLDIPETLQAGSP